MRKIILLTSLILSSFFITACSNEKTIIFDYQYGEEKVNKNDDPNISHIPDAKDGEHFVGWFIDEELKVRYDHKKHHKNKNLKLYAKFINLDIEYFVYKYNEAYNNHLNSEAFEVLSIGEIDTKLGSIGKQSLMSIKQYKDDKYYQYTATYGILATLRTYYELHGTKDELLRFDGKSKEDLSPGEVLKESKIDSIINKKESGIDIDELNHIVNSSEVAQVLDYKLENGEVYFELALKSETINSNYKTYIQSTNPLAIKPFNNNNVNFSKVVLKVLVDENGYFKQIDYVEDYEVKLDFFIKKQNVSATITEKFEYDKNKISINLYGKGK